MNPVPTDARRIALFGFHRFTLEVAGYLAPQDYHVTIIDDDEGHLIKAREQGYQTAKLDYRDDHELEDLGLPDNQDAIFSLFPDDAENVFLTISVRALAPRATIITIAHQTDAVATLHAAGADKVIDVHDITGRRIWSLLKHPNVTDLLENTLFGQTPLNLAGIPVIEGSMLADTRLCDLRLARDYNLIVTGVVDQDMGQKFIVSTEGGRHRLASGDTLLVIGPADAIERLRADAGISAAAE